MYSRIQRRSWRTVENACYVDWQGLSAPAHTDKHGPRSWEPILCALSPYGCRITISIGISAVWAR
jgi:hypothetical protein